MHRLGFSRWSLVLVSYRHASCPVDGWTCCAKSRCSPRPISPTGWCAAWSRATRNAAFAHARDVISLERSLHVFVEPSIQAWASGSHTLMDLLSWLYVNAQTTVTVSALVYLYLRHNRSFYFVRNMFVIAMFVALIGYAVFPTAPPRFMPEWGFIDSVANVTGVHVNARERRAERAGQPLRGRALDARLLRADDRLAARAPGAASGREGAVVRSTRS